MYDAKTPHPRPCTWQNFAGVIASSCKPEFMSSQERVHICMRRAHAHTCTKHIQACLTFKKACKAGETLWHVACAVESTAECHATARHLASPTHNLEVSQQMFRCVEKLRSLDFAASRQAGGVAAPGGPWLSTDDLRATALEGANGQGRQLERTRDLLGDVSSGRGMTRL